MAEYQAPVRGGARCEDCGALVSAYRVMREDGGCRIRYHRCGCGWFGKSVEKIIDSGEKKQTG
jgi:hypothetical protein